MWRFWGWLLLIPVLALAGTGMHVDHRHWRDIYDPLFRKYTKHYFGPHVDWRWFKAQGIAESGLNPHARSPAGALGIMQILPSTYREIRRRNPLIQDISELRWNIAAAIFYDRQLYLKWKRKPDLNTGDCLKFTFASYNAGYGRILKAYDRARRKHGKIRRWEHVAPFVPPETRAYVARIQRLMDLKP